MLLISFTFWIWGNCSEVMLCVTYNLVTELRLWASKYLFSYFVANLCITFSMILYLRSIVVFNIHLKCYDLNFNRGFCTF